MTTLELLQKSAPELGFRVAAASSPDLRRIAFVVAAAAVKGSGLKHETIQDILRDTDPFLAGDEKLCAELEGIAEGLDQEYFELSEAAETESDAQQIPHEVTAAFRKARAASAVAAALQLNAASAAAEAAYEALAATDDEKSLIVAIDNALTSKRHHEDAFTLLDLLVVLTGGVPAVFVAHRVFKPSWLVPGATVLTLVFGACIWCIVFLWLIPRLTRKKDR